MATTTFDRWTRPRSTALEEATSHRKTGLGIAAAGLVLAAAVTGLGVAAGGALDGGDATTVGRILAVAFGLNTLALATLKTGIVVVLVGILVRLWIRVDTVKRAVAELRPDVASSEASPPRVDTPHGPATVGSRAPTTLPIHRMARTLWGPLLAMGAMLVAGGFVAALVWSSRIGTDETVTTLAAWTQGVQFLGEAMVLGGISLLLGSILGGLRDGGGEVQEALGVPVITLEMPAAAKAFIGLMTLGMAVSMAQFVLYLVTTGFDDPGRIAVWFTWLGPLRELGLALLLSGIVLALGAIGKVLGFQFDRIRTIVATGR